MFLMRRLLATTLLAGVCALPMTSAHAALTAAQQATVDAATANPTADNLNALGALLEALGSSSAPGAAADAQSVLATLISIAQTGNSTTAGLVGTVLAIAANDLSGSGNVALANSIQTAVAASNVPTMLASYAAGTVGGGGGGPGGGGGSGGAFGGSGNPNPGGGGTGNNYNPNSQGNSGSPGRT